MLCHFQRRCRHKGCFKELFWQIIHNLMLLSTDITTGDNMPNILIPLLIILFRYRIQSYSIQCGVESKPVISFLTQPMEEFFVRSPMTKSGSSGGVVVFPVVLRSRSTRLSAFSQKAAAIERMSTLFYSLSVAVHIQEAIQYSSVRRNICLPDGASGRQMRSVLRS